MISNCWITRAVVLATACGVACALKTRDQCSDWIQKKKLKKLGEGTFGEVFKMNKTHVFKQFKGDDKEAAEAECDTQNQFSELGSPTPRCDQPHRSRCKDRGHVMEFIPYSLTTAMNWKMEGADADQEHADGLSMIWIPFIKASKSFLAASMKLQISHRDIKPDNMMYNLKKKEVFVIDFGEAVNFNLVTKLGGTPTYMPPEALVQLLQGGRRETVDEKRDLFALGMVAFDVLKLTFSETYGENIDAIFGRGEFTPDSKQKRWLEVVAEGEKRFKNYLTDVQKRTSTDQDVTVARCRLLLLNMASAWTNMDLNARPNGNVATDAMKAWLTICDTSAKTTDALPSIQKAGFHKLAQHDPEESISVGEESSSSDS